MRGSTNDIALSTTPWKLAACLTLAGASTVLLLGAVRWSGELALIAVGLLSFLAIIVPFLVKRHFDPFEPITLFAFSVLMGCTLRAVLLAVSDPTNYKIAVLTDGMSNGAIAANAALIPLSLLFLSTGYILASRKRFPIENFPVLRSANWNHSRLLFAVGLLSIISLAAILQLSRLTGVDLSNLAGLSMKRAVEVNTDSGVGYASLGYLRWAADLAKIGLLLLFAAQCSSSATRRRTSLPGRLVYGTILFVLVLLSVAWPILSSSRTGILEVFFGLAVVLTYLGLKGGEKARRRKFNLIAAVAVVFAVFVLVAVGLWRQYSQRGETLDTSVGQAVVNNTVGSGNFLPLERTAVIIDRMPERGDWQLGGTYLNTLFAPIPRSVWHDKPEISTGLYVKRVVYARPTYMNGYPPGLLGEAFMNFGVTGLVVIPFMAGLFLKLLFNSFRPLLINGHKSAVLLYALVLWPVGFQLADLDFSLFVVNLLAGTLPGIVALSFIVPRSKARGATRAG